MKDISRNLGPILSLVIFLIAGGAWVRSRYFVDALYYRTPLTEYRVSSMSGRLHLWRDLNSNSPLGWHVRHVPLLPIPNPVHRRPRPAWWSPRDVLPYWESGDRTVLFPEHVRVLMQMPELPNSQTYRFHLAYRYYDLQLPYWMFMAPALIAPALRVRRILRARRRRKRGLCVRCGYDLRASSDRCPECGTAIPPASGQMADGSGAAGLQ